MWCVEFRAKGRFLGEDFNFWSFVGKRGEISKREKKACGCRGGERKGVVSCCNCGVYLEEGGG